MDIEAFCIYRGGIFHRNVSLLGRPKSILVRDGLINVRFQTGSDFKTIVYTSDGSYSHEYCIGQLDSPCYLCDCRVCEFTQNHDGGVRQITDTSQLMSVTWIRKMISYASVIIHRVFYYLHLKGKIAGMFGWRETQRLFVGRGTR